MVSKEECEREGGIYVKAHNNGKGGWTKAYCKEMANKEKKMTTKEILEAYYRMPNEPKVMSDKEKTAFDKKWEKKFKKESIIDVTTYTIGQK